MIFAPSCHHLYRDGVKTLVGIVVDIWQMDVEHPIPIEDDTV
jgi:hypothetical protein